MAFSGCWVHPPRPIEGGVAVGVSGTTMTLGGRPFVAAGTTYMPPDTQRRFLLEPSGAIDEGLATISAHGGNLIRTGIWTGWSLHAGPTGEPTPAVLEAMDAFLLSVTHAHGLAVVFTFFAFLPHAWGGTNPISTRGPSTLRSRSSPQSSGATAG